MKEPTPEHKFKGNLSVLDVVMITASGVTPASSIFVIAPLAIASAGSGAFISFLIAAFIAATIALCYAELGAAHPSAGGEYSIIKRLFGTLCGLQTYLFILSAALFVPAVLATGAVPYLNTALGTQFDASTAGMITILIGGACAIFNIKANALLTGTFLVVEIAVLGLIAWLGFSNPHQSADILTAPVMLNPEGVLAPVSVPLIVAMVGVALFSYNGYGAAVYMAEDMREQGKPMATAIMLTLVIVVLVELLPFTALLIGAPSLVEMAKQADPVGYVVSQLGGPTLARVVSGAIYLSVFNAIIAIVAQFSRMMFSSGRDGFWLPQVNRALKKIHPRFGTPWIATLLFGIPSALLAFCSNLGDLTSFTVILLLLVYIIMAIAALISRRRVHFHHPYLMPLWPLPVVIALLGCLYVLWTILIASSLKDFIIIAGILCFGLVLSYMHTRQTVPLVEPSIEGE
ncbi:MULTISPECIES: APC family permease [Serratia]|jgi:amino acid transporter|uniref:Amino acid permease n=1 Tax=Serratia grimesii TaxID=82995 RepID=A0A7G2JJP9_9GAMM|nr:APC family permease [Serratia grimesii]CAI1032886.1 Serine/threonine exchanger SteT [Serratia grimesii]CAI1085473.1 Serine/threonine exchanger SteT [Serratia grimesii]CAI2790784.1 Serine/threonine exchanger SteT [Serratia grimesii]CUW02742.1 putative amino acid permease YhdG [Serratia grimesii]SMZ54941.1 putative amino acid permease YhdG [Serratia grimesii]